MKNYRAMIAALAAMACVSCTQKAVIDLSMPDCPDAEVVVKQLNINSYNILDTLKTDSQGCLRYKVSVGRNQPEFIYLFKGDNTVAALLLEQGEKAFVEADTLGNYSVTGSEGSAKLKEANDSYSRFIYRMAELTEMLDNGSLPQGALEGVSEEMTKLYIDHYRECLKFVIANPYSLAVVPVLFQKISDYTPVFSQPADGIRMKTAYDSLMTVYPESRYVQALGKEAERRLAQMNIANRINSADPAGYFDIKAPDINGKERSLGEIDSKAVLIHFWSAQDAVQKMFNIETLKPLYDEFHSKGFEIFSVCVDPDKARWATTVRNQNLEWINVNDGLGADSAILGVYNVTELPVAYFIIDGEISPEKISGADDLKRILRKYLK